MSGVYRADPASKGVRDGRAGLALPFTPTKGPIKFRQDHNNYFDSPMVFSSYSDAAPWIGEASGLKAGGITTSGVDDCSVVCVAELKGTIGNGASWGKVFFAHLAGGGWLLGDPKRKFEIFMSMVSPKDCYSLVYANRDGSVGESVSYILGNKFPAEKMSVYITNAHTTNFAIEFKVMGEYGQTFSSGSGGSNRPPYGYLSKKVGDYFRI